MYRNRTCATLSLISALFVLASCGVSEVDGLRAFESVEQALGTGSDFPTQCRAGGTIRYEPPFTGGASYENTATFSSCAEYPASGSIEAWIFDGTVKVKRVLVGDHYETSYVGDVSFYQGLEADCHIDMKRGPATGGGIERNWGTACDQEIDFTEHSF